MNKSVIERWREDEQAPFKGWSFSYLKDRLVEEKPHWDYVAQARQATENFSSILDIATGGGEMLVSLGGFKGKKVVAIESYEPNIAVANMNLASLGVSVLRVDETKPFPFDNEEFGLVLNRHGWLNIGEIFRVLEKGGLFLTQQVSGDNLSDLQEFFDKKPNHPNNNLFAIEKELSKVGMEIVSAEDWEGKTSFKDVGALVYYLKKVPWVIEGFSVDTHLSILEMLQEKIEKEGSLSFSSKRFLIKARKV